MSVVAAAAAAAVLISKMHCAVPWTKQIVPVDEENEIFPEQSYVTTNLESCDEDDCCKFCNVRLKLQLKLRRMLEWP